VRSPARFAITRELPQKATTGFRWTVVQAPGETQLIPDYRRPWEEDAEPADRKQHSFPVK